MVNFLNVFLFLMQPVGFLYGLLMRIREILYSTGIFKVYSLDASVISVGNLTMGGSGKTPVVIYLAKLLQKNGFKPAVVSRGYKGKARQAVNIVSNGKNVVLDCHKAGDEPYLIAESLQGIPVLTGKKRIHPCCWAIEKFGCNVIILDDAFQHLSVKRDLDLVLFNSASLKNADYVFPSGVLREFPGALHRSSCILFTNSEEENYNSIRLYKNKISRYIEDKPVFLTEYTPTAIVDVHGQEISPNQIPLNFAAFCGIASPHRFKNSFKKQFPEGRFLHGFPDHHDYSAEDLCKLEEEAASCGSNALLTTQKDIVKLRGLKTKLPLYALAMDVFADSEFDRFVLQNLSR